MKKIMIAACAVAFTAAAQAATATWNWEVSTASYAGNATDIAANKTAYLICYSTDYYAGTVGISQADLLAAFRNGTDVATAAGGYLIGTSATGADGTIAQNAVTFNDALIEDDYVSAYYVLVDGKNIFLSEDSWYTLDPLNPGKGIFNNGSGNTMYTIDTTGKAAYSDPGWYMTQDVPEPTSGLLLLLGVAGLALRRRRA